MQRVLRLLFGSIAVVGSVLGIVMLIPFLAVGSRFGFPGEYMLFLVFALYVYGIWGGIGAVRNHTGWQRHTKYFWLAQVPAFYAPAFAYVVSSCAGVWVYARVSPLGAGAHAYLGSAVQFALGKGLPGLAVGVNLLALGIVVVLQRITPADA
jgi:hypothetical protein